ncbi:VOC family protein [Shewanella psychromarinicola]|uniref:VOC family protein n=1 Tax=Shewanella psychromarinicola TaxID=2487742 RepID=A0A3N4F0B2_9GAMM|nr:VOC family protein [Shewanella psychromarinicola]AZG36653.1 VOC family protein [Shewanella psychromarinicola]MCL1082338.1 VOC family protein [Shewanella psychromarinicola]RPA34504.1 VOC family protein [Shewanella psychromarinicola]
MSQHHSINYLEIPVKDIIATKAFFTQVFGWQFQDYGPEYSCFLKVGIDGGFYRAECQFTLAKGSPLIVLYSQDLGATAAQIIQAGGQITKAVFSFPGGRRFHFSDTNGNEYGVWSE